MRVAKLLQIIEAAESKFDKCVKDKLDDPKFTIKGNKYKTREEAASALCAWIGSRSSPGKFPGKKPYGKNK